YLLFFAMNGYVLSIRDFHHLRRRAKAYQQLSAFLPNINSVTGEWMGRHIAGMVGSMLANLSVVVLTLLPLSLHWLWPVGLLLAGAYIADKERKKKQRVIKAIPPVLQPKFGVVRHRRNDDEDVKKAA